ncbi:hypothetical protein [Dechloromonas denitrificans]|uniref:hypothetical protein n=1 Tax=Dechloromonas denitrificans TaxID=281362 RepID=UPI001CF8E991|nr:hypothetical protein [Dechloromonas denitrificans]UCV02290.1 hypothetical protein KI611_14485 [Dechloromonas denitrificans]
MMVGATIIDIGTRKALEANGASIASGALAQANDASYDIVSDGGGCTDAKFIISGTFTTAPTENTTLAVYAQPLDIDGTNDADAPETTRPTVFVGTVQVNNVTSTQYFELLAENVPWKANYYLHNNGTGQTLSAGWKMDVIPYTSSPSA